MAATFTENSHTVHADDSFCNLRGQRLLLVMTGFHYFIEFFTVASLQHFALCQCTSFFVGKIIREKQQ